MLPAFSFSVLPGGKGKSRVSALFKTGASVSFSATFRGMPVLPRRLVGPVCSAVSSLRARPVSSSSVSSQSLWEQRAPSSR